MKLAVDEAAGAWPVLSKSESRGTRRGWCMPTVIHNWHHHCAKLLVFEDGVIDCWGGLDISLFREKLTTHWIATSVPQGGRLSIFNLGVAAVVQCEPFVFKEDILARVMDALQYWNPDLVDLVDLGGDATEPIPSAHPRARRAKLPSLDGIPFYTNEAGELLEGSEVPIFLRQDGEWRLTRWFVYADGKSRLGPDGPLFDLAATEVMVLSERVAMSVPDDTWVLVDGIGRMRFSEGLWRIDPAERVREQRNNLGKLQGRRDVIRACIDVWASYQNAPSSVLLEAVRGAYFAVPKHLRMYCGDMDTKDVLIRRALGLSDRDED